MRNHIYKPTTKRYSRIRPKNTRPQYGPRRNMGPKLDISAFINKELQPEQEVEAFVPEHTFRDFGLAPVISSIIEKRGYKNPTAIQDQIIPHIMQKTDVVGLANTGTGKTAAFLIPLIHKALENRGKGNGQVLVLAPTRELALQIDQEFRLFASQLSLYSTVCVGGESIGMQIRQLRRQNHFIIGTPGRVIDLIKRNVISLNTIHTVVLDEADRMLDMGFIQDIRFILAGIRKDRHTMLFSATMSPRIKGLISDFLRDPVMVSVKTHETPNNIHQDVVSCKNENKIDLLSRFLADQEFKKVLVFGRTKHGVERLCKELSRRGVKVDSIHSNKSHGQRQYALRNFKENRLQALVATDIAARGLDIEGVTHVINYELPATYEDYVHRIGRTGRGANKGKALTFVD